MAGGADAACVLDGSAPAADRFIRHLSDGCTEAERAAQAVPAAAIMTALEQGRAVDLAGVIVEGHLNLERLPTESVSSVPLPQDVLRRLAAQGLTAVHVLRAPLRIVRSRIHGPVGAMPASSYLAAVGDVDLTGTVFESRADWSRTAFLGRLTATGAVFRQEAFFLQAWFDEPVRFDRAAFGPHTRFHRAHFADTVTFLHAGFTGLAELLEVTFAKDAAFSHVAFKAGTGFSGSRFAGLADFTESVFDREAYFLFTVFERDAAFGGAVFHNVADFSDARFMGGDDFSRTHFEQAPRLVRTQLSGPLPGTGLTDMPVLYLIGGILVAFAVIVVLVLWKG